MLVRAIKPFDKKQPGTVFDTTSFHAAELIRNGMAVEHKMRTPPVNKAAPTPQNKSAPSTNAGKAPDDGGVPPSSVSQADPASPLPTSSTSASGARPTLRLRKPRAKS